MNFSGLSKRHEYINFLLKIQKTVPSAIIAGGALRDQYHDIKINDIDIYVPNVGEEIYSEKYWKQLFNLKIGKLFSADRIKMMSADSEEGYIDKNFICDVWEITKNRIDYNIIVVDIPPIEYVNKYFDIGLCKAYCDGIKIHFTADFMHDSKFKHLTIVTENIENIGQAQFDFMMDHHIHKLQTKYPTHTLVVPAKYADLYNEYMDYE